MEEDLTTTVQIEPNTELVNNELEDKIPVETFDEEENEQETSIKFHTKIFNFFKNNIRLYFENLKTIIFLAVPVIISYLASMSMGIVDQIFLGHLGSTELAASAFANAINMCLSYVVIGLASGLDTMGSQAFGNKNYKFLGALVQRGFVSMTIFYIPIAILLFFVPNVLSLINHNEKFVYLVGIYIRILIPGNLFYIYHHVLEEFLNSQNIMLPNMIALLLSNVFNLVANTILIYGTLIPGWDGLGYIGAPIATSLGKLFGFLTFLSIILLFGLQKQTWFGIQFKEAISPKEMWKFLKIAVPGMVQVCLELWGFNLMTIPAMFLGETYLDGHSLIFTISGFSFMIPLGLSVAASVRVGNSIGEGNIRVAKISAFICISLGVFFMAFNALIILVFRNLIPRIFTSDEDVIKITADAFFVVVGFQLFDGFQGVCSGVLRGLGKQTIGALFMFVSFYVLGIPVAIFFAFVLKWNVVGLWSGLTVGLMSVAGFFGAYIIFFINWEKEVELAQKRVGIEETVKSENPEDYSKELNENLEPEKPDDSKESKEDKVDSKEFSNEDVEEKSDDCDLSVGENEKNSLKEQLK
eukprot:gene8615-562_t